jgi:HAE1 family hydrophobic/amphiphilic exporter-1
MSRFFIDRPIVAIVAAIFFVIAGAVMVLRLPIAQFPDIVPPQIQTTATYPGADALTMEQSVATPIEEQVNGGQEHDLYAVDQRQRRHDDGAGQFRGRD